MLTIPLSRPAYCGGVQSLSFLLSKLARMGESVPAELAAALPSCRVSWLMLGNVLTVREVRHAHA